MAYVLPISPGNEPFDNSHLDLMTSLAYRISGFNRKRKWDLFWEVVRPDPADKVLDAGLSDEEYSASDNYLEKHYPYRSQVTALGIDMAQKFRERYPEVRTVQYPGGRFPFGDKEFDICWSNAVLEHVGGREKQVLFLKEIDRVARTSFITTPNRHFPFEIHTRTPFLHLLFSKRAFDRYLSLTRRSWATGDYMNLLTKQEVKECLSAAGINHCKIVENRLGALTLDFMILFGERVSQ